jgi:heme a synthase
VSRPLSTLGPATRGVLAYTLFVILFGAVVRITGSGAGCGQHWPSCHGEIAHLPRSLETLIELTHRATSGGALLAVLWLAVLAVRRSPPGHRVRKTAYLAVALMIFEALIGAALVLLELVGADASVGRAVVMPLHLVSTYALTAVLTLGVHFASAEQGAPAGGAPAAGRTAFLLGALALVLVSATGAITALGDTVAPPAGGSLAARLLEDQGAGATFLQRLRIIHPVLAVLTAIAIARHALYFTGGDEAPALRTPARAVLIFVVAQLAAGVLNVLLSAPGWLQVAHLALALGLWIAFVTLAANALSRPSAAAPQAPAGARALQGRASG